MPPVSSQKRGSPGRYAPDISGSATGFSRSGMAVTAGANNGSARSVTYTASFSIGGLSGSDSCTITQDGASVTWRMKSLSISPSTIQVGGTTTSYEAKKEKYVNGVASGELADASVTGWASSAPGIATVSSGTVTGVAAGTVTITATDPSCESGYQTASAGVTVEPRPDDFKWIDTGITISAGSSASASFKSTSSTVRFDCPDGISPYNHSISETADSDGYYSGTATFSASADCTDGQSGIIVGSAGSASDDLPLTVQVAYEFLHASLVLEKTEGGMDYYYVLVTYGPRNETAKVTDSFSISGSGGGFSVSLAWDKEDNSDPHNPEWVEGSSVVPHGTRVQVTVNVSTGDSILLQ